MTVTQSIANSMVPVTVLTGFLGAGKTTLLKRILTEYHGQRIAVIENEFGPESIDNELLVQDSDEEIIELNNGCVCCTVRGDLLRTLIDLKKRRQSGDLKFERVIIETTGMADPGPVCQTFFLDDEVAEFYRLDAVITIVDAKHGMETLDRQPEAQSQVGFADCILISKCDLVSKEQYQELRHRLVHINPRAQIEPVNFGEVDLNKVLDISGFNLDAILNIDADFLKDDECGVHCHHGEPGHVCDASCHHNPNHVHDSNCTHDCGEHCHHGEPGHACDASCHHNPNHVHDSNCTHDCGEHCHHGEPGHVCDASCHHNPNHVHDENCHHDCDDDDCHHGEPGHVCDENCHHNPNHHHDEHCQHGHHHHHHHHNDEIGAFVFTSDKAFNPALLEEFFGGLIQIYGPDLYRYKGILYIQGIKQRMLLQGVHMMLGTEPGKPWGDEKPYNKLVFIGKKLPKDAFTQGLEQCLVRQ